jgi:hypothetical protein
MCVLRPSTIAVSTRRLDRHLVSVPADLALPYAACGTCLTFGDHFLCDGRHFGSEIAVAWRRRDKLV